MCLHTENCIKRYFDRLQILHSRNLRRNNIQISILLISLLDRRKRGSEKEGRRGGKTEGRTERN